MLRIETKPRSGYLWSLAVVSACTVITRLMHAHFEITNLAMIYLLGVVVVATWFGRGPSIMAAVLSVMAFDFFCVPPYFTFVVAQTQYVVTFAIMFIVGLLISTLTDTITQQAREREELAVETEQARLLVKSEQLRNSLLSCISHDLRTPLATIAGAASGIVSGTAELDVANCRSLAQEIYEEAMRLNRLVGNLLDMTKLQSGTLVPAREGHPVDELVGAALTYIDERSGAHTIKTDIPDSLPFVSVDPILLQQVLLNLIENAIKYTPPLSTIEITASQPNGSDTVLVSVSDQGPGIDDAYKERVFEKFYRQGQSSAGGAGLGLAICRGIIEAHGGKIWIEDRTAGGACFKFTLAVDATLPVVDEDDDGEVREPSHVNK